MGFDPTRIETSPEGKRADTFADLDRRVRNLERGQRTIQVITGSPTAGVSAGAPVVDDGAPAGTIRLGIYVPSRGGWKYTTLT